MMKQSLLSILLGLFAASLFAVANADTAQTPGGALEALELNPGYPRTLFFRHELWLSRQSREEGLKEIERFDGVSIKLFNEAPRQDYRALIPLIAEFKRRRPEAPVLVHIDHIAAVRPLEGARLSPGRTFPEYEPHGIFPGHWLYYAPSELTAPLSADATSIKVADVGRFHPGDDVRIVPVGAEEKPSRWRESEVVLIERIDAEAGLLIVERGKYGTNARSFQKGAMAAPHCKMKYGNPAWYWSYNFARVAPRDEEGRAFTEWFADWVAREIKAVNDGHGIRVIDGVEFDVTKFNLSFGRQPLEGVTDEKGPQRLPDTNLDGRPDLGYVKGQPENGFGTIATMARLRERLGPDFLITGDSIWTLWRPWPYANGMDNESFPDIRKSWRWSGAFERLTDWSRHAAEPHMNFIFTRASKDLLPGQKDAFQSARHGLAAALMVGGWHCMMGFTGEGSRYCDEYDGGDPARRHWLGQPLGDFVRRPNLAGPNLFAAGGFDTAAQIGQAGVFCDSGHRVEGPAPDRLPGQSGVGCLRVRHFIEPDERENVHSVDVRLSIPFKAEKEKEYALSFLARADHEYARHEPTCDGVPWGLTVSLYSGSPERPMTGQHALLIPGQWRRFHISAVARPVSEPAEFRFEIGAEPGTLWLDDLSIREGGGDIFYRRFEGGLVLLSGSRSPAFFDLAAIEPDRSLRRLKATGGPETFNSDPAINTGAALDKTVPLEVPPFDARFLLAD